MADKSAIEWTDATWNPIVGCSIVSPGCTNCYAMKMAARIERMRAPERRGDVILPHHYTALTEPSKAGPVWTGRVSIAPDHILTQPLRWKRGRKIFVNSMGDLFHESIPDEWIDRVFAVMALCPQHTFQVLTKRAERMRDYCCRLKERAVEIAQRAVWLGIWDDPDIVASDAVNAIDAGPLPNVWLGVSTERQKEADERVPFLLQTPAAVRFISAEPLLGPVEIDCPNVDWMQFPEGNGIVGDSLKIDWVIVGGESGPNARPMHPDWARSLRDQCAAAGVPFFFKQWGQHVHATQCDLRADDPFTEVWLDQDTVVARVRKSRAGRLLDGREHNEFPAAAKAQAA